MIISVITSPILCPNNPLIISPIFCFNISLIISLTLFNILYQNQPPTRINISSTPINVILPSLFERLFNSFANSDFENKYISLCENSEKRLDFLFISANVSSPI